MPTRTFEQTFDIAAPLEVVRAFLLDPHTFPKIHPLIANVTVTGERQEGPIRVVEFEALELVPIAGFRWRNQLRCESFDDPSQPRRARARAFAAAAVTVDSEYTLEPVGDGCRTTQRLTLTAPWGLTWFVYRTGVAAHVRQAAATQAHFARMGPQLG